MTVKQLGRYEILDELGRGAMGIVYKARDPIIDRVVALKTIDFALTGAAAASFEERFFQEARAAGRLNHPNIVTIYDAGQADGVAYIAMEFLEGTNLRDILDKQPPLPIARIVEITGQIARGLAFAHEQGVIHRDIKPANVIVLRNRRPKITDFGIARLCEADGRSGERAGSPKYMAPEQIRADATIDGRADVFSLGAMVYEMLTGTQPFTGETVGEIMQQVLEVDPPPPSTLNTRVSPELDAMVLRMLAKRAEDRFPSARSLFRELRRVEEQLEGRTTREAADEAEVAAAGVASNAHGEGDKTLVLSTAPAAAGARAPWSTPRRIALAAAGIVVAIAVLIPLRFQFSDASARRTEVAAAPPPVVVDAIPAPAREPVPSEPAVEPPPPPLEPVKAAPPPPPKRAAPARPQAKAPTPPRVPVAAPAPTPPPPAQIAATPPPKPVAPPQTAKLLLAVTPRGEVYIDGKHLGTTPPLSVIELPAGRHKVEIRNSTRLPYLSYITLQAGASHSVQHVFVD